MRVMRPSSCRASEGLPSLNAAPWNPRGVEILHLITRNDAAAERPMPGKSRAPATSRVCAAAFVAAPSERVIRRRRGLSRLRDGVIGKNPQGCGRASAARKAAAGGTQIIRN